MRVIVGIDLGSTTTKAVLLDEQGEIVGRGITNSRSNYEVACAVARREALTAARMSMLRRAIDLADGMIEQDVAARLSDAFRLEVYLGELAALAARIYQLLDHVFMAPFKSVLEPAASQILDTMAANAPALFLDDTGRKSDFFRDIAGAAFTSEAERLAARSDVPFDRLIGLFDRAILDVETTVRNETFADNLKMAAERIFTGADSVTHAVISRIVLEVAESPIEEVAFSGTGYGRQTLPFPKAAVRSEILCHGRGAHRVFPGTKTVLDIGGQDTKAIQIDENGVVTSFQMNDRCAAGCGRYLGYIADELNLGLHELGPLALKADKVIRVNSTCTVFAGAELRERLALGQKREDVLAGLHRSIMLRAMSLLARSGGIRDEFTFTGGVCKNPMATKMLRELVDANYGVDVTLNAHPDSIYMGALGAAMFALDDLRAGKANILPTYDIDATAKSLDHTACSGCITAASCD